MVFEGTIPGFYLLQLHTQLLKKELSTRPAYAVHRREFLYRSNTNTLLFLFTFQCKPYSLPASFL